MDAGRPQGSLHHIHTSRVPTPGPLLIAPRYTSFSQHPAHRFADAADDAVAYGDHLDFFQGFAGAFVSQLVGQRFVALRDLWPTVDVEEFDFCQQRAASFANGIQRLRGGNFLAYYEGQIFHDWRVVADGPHGLQLPAWLDKRLNVHFSRVDARGGGYVEVEQHLRVDLADDAQRTS